jgi:DNA-binding MarR family transcriptional regulator
VKAGRSNTARGEEAGPAVLTEWEVREIRFLYEEGHYSQRELGERFGVHQMTISDIVRGKTWSHLN